MLFSFENVYRQYLACRRNKRNTLNALRFECRQEKNLLALKRALETRTYRPSRSVCFVAKLPKHREIFAADFKDRIVHHILVDELEKVWEPIFVYDSYACRRGKGIHRAVSRLQGFIKKTTRNGTRPACYLQLDIKNYFMTIDKNILYAMIAPRVKHEDLLWLVHLLIFHDCTENPIVRGDRTALKNIPPRKTLFHAPRQKGLPIGNLNSQFFANVYLNSLDQFVKHHLKCQYYLRYCDDFVLLSHERETLIRWREEIEAYLKENLQLELNQKQRLRPLSNGIDFLGYIVRKDYLLVRRRVVKNLQAKLRVFETQLVREGKGVRRYLFDEAILDKLMATVSSYLGHFKMADTHNLCSSLWRQHPFLSQYFSFDPKNRKLERKYKYPKEIRKTCQQYHYYRWRFPDDDIFFQVGNFFEFYHDRDQEIADYLGLSKMRKNTRGAKYGFPVNMMNQYAGRLLQCHRSIIFIRETGRYWTRIKERVPVYRLERSVVSVFTCI